MSNSPIYEVSPNQLKDDFCSKNLETIQGKNTHKLKEKLFYL